METFPDSFAAFSSERFIFTRFHQGDAEDLQRITDDPTITEPISFLNAPFTLADARQFIEVYATDKDRIFAGRRKLDGELVSLIGAHLDGAGNLEIGYWVGSRFHRQGIGYEAADALISNLQQAFPGTEIFAECAPENKASWGLLLKLGFIPTGRDGARPGRKLFNFSGRA